MSHSYRALVEAVGDKMIAEGLLEDVHPDDAVPLDSLAKADSLGFATDTFAYDVLAYVADVQTPADPRQSTFQF
jgi:hypothetical protein